MASVDALNDPRPRVTFAIRLSMEGGLSGTARSMVGQAKLWLSSVRNPAFGLRRSRGKTPSYQLPWRFSLSKLAYEGNWRWFMNIEASYIGIASFFDVWVRVMEARTRTMEAHDAQLNDSRILMICPPTDRGMAVLANRNSQGESYLLCLSPAVERIARRYMSRRNIENVAVCTGDFFNIPFDNEFFNAIFANCFFDFCQERDLDMIVREIQRALQPGGALFSVYMALPSDVIGRVWVALFQRIRSLSHGCRPVDIKPTLVKRGFIMKTTLSLSRFGFPIEYIHAEKRVKQPL